MSANSSSLTHIANPYSIALYELAFDDKSVAKTQKALEEIANLADKNDDFARMLASPLISATDKSNAITKILTKLKTPTLATNFIKLVAKHDRLIVLPTMIELFKKIAANARGETVAEIISASKLSKKQLDNLTKVLKKKIGKDSKTIKLQTHVDPSLIGGLIVKVGSQMIDSSLKTKLSAMKIAMKEIN